jgi:hypothetical protein
LSSSLQGDQIGRRGSLARGGVDDDHEPAVVLGDHIHVLQIGNEIRLAAVLDLDTGVRLAIRRQMKLTFSLGWEVQTAITVAPEATPALMPDGESSTTRHRLTS